jgi:hypothetical protein
MRQSDRISKQNGSQADRQLAQTRVRESRRRLVPEIDLQPTQPTAFELIHFEQTCELLRHHSSLRVRQLTVFVAVNGGLLLALFRFGGDLTARQLTAAAAFGILAAFAFAMLEVRLNIYVDHHRRVALSYEQRFGLSERLFAPELRSLFFRGRLAVLLLISSAVGAWLLILSLLSAGKAPSPL